MKEPTYISEGARVDNVYFEGKATILGPTKIGKASIIGLEVIIGYPSRNKLLKFKNRNCRAFLEELDKLSEGARIGENCILRPKTIVYENSIIGDYVETGHYVLIRENVRIGENSKIGTGTVVDGEVVIGKNVNIQSQAYIPKGSIIGDNVFIAPRVCFTNDRYPPSTLLKGVEVGEGAVIGAGAILISGIKIGERAVVAAGAVVTGDVPEEAVVAGVPARIIGWRREYEDKKREYERGKKLWGEVKRAYGLKQ